MEEAFNESAGNVESDAAHPEIAAAPQTVTGMTSLLNKLLVLLMIAILLTLSLPAILTLVGARRETQWVPVRDPIIRTRKQPSEQTENIA